MRQRAALARALSLETGILLMDEPFGALDEQTRMVLGEDLSVLLSRTGKTIVFVTHSLGEAVFLADRVAVFSARPGTIKEVIEIDEPHPRKPAFMTSEKFTDLRNTLFALLHEEIRKAMEQSAASDRAAGGNGAIMSAAPASATTQGARSQERQARPQRARKPSGAGCLRRRACRPLVYRHDLWADQPDPAAQSGQGL